ncbi:MAG: SGNH hydrolase domain-containing protein [Planctomycetaceae bacterium]
MPRVVLIEQPPEPSTYVNRNAAPQYLCYQHVVPQPGLKKYLPAADIDAGLQGRDFIRSLAHSYKNCRILPTYDLYARGTQALCLDGRNVVYADDDHLSTYGTMMAAERLEAMIAEIMKSPGTQLIQGQ